MNSRHDPPFVRMEITPDAHPILRQHPLATPPVLSAAFRFAGLGVMRATTCGGPVLGPHSVTVRCPERPLPWLPASSLHHLLPVGPV